MVIMMVMMAMMMMINDDDDEDIDVVNVCELFAWKCNTIIFVSVEKHKNHKVF